MARPVTATTVLQCWLCTVEQVARPGLVEACTAAGIDSGVPVRVLLLEYLAGRHRDGHRSLPALLQALAARAR